MKTLNIFDCLWWVQFDDVRPSAFQKFINDMNEWLPGYMVKLRQLLEKSESEIRAHTTISDLDFERIKERFAEFGLHFGMTEQEFADYIDKDYLQKHPEEKEQVDIEADEIVLDEQVLESRIQEAIAAENLYEESLPIWVEKERRAELNKLLQNGDLMQQLDSDYEWMLYRALYVAYQQQPWYYRLCFTQEERMQKAKEEAEKLMKTFTDDLVNKIIERDHKDYQDRCQRIKQANTNKRIRCNALREEVTATYKAEQEEALKRKKAEEAEARQKAEEAKGQQTVEEAKAQQTVEEPGLPF